jgi:hypothetical protein
VGKEYKKESVSGDLIPLVNKVVVDLDVARLFYTKYFEEMYSITMDAQKNMLWLREFFKSLLELSEKTEAIKFYEYPIANTEHLIYIAILKYIYNALLDVFQTTRTILEEQEYQTRIMKLDNYLSNQKLQELKFEIYTTEEKIKEYEAMEEFDASQKIVNLNKSLKKDKNEIKFFDIVFKLLDESKKVDEVLKSRLKFAMNLLKYSNSLKKVHPNLPAALIDYLEKLDEFSKEIDKIIKELKGKSKSGLISPFDFRERSDAAEDSKKELTTLSSNQEFVNHVKTMLEASKIDIFE